MVSWSGTTLATHRKTGAKILPVKTCCSFGRSSSGLYTGSAACGITVLIPECAFKNFFLKHNSKICKPALQKLKEFQAHGYECALATNQDGARKSHIIHWLEQYDLHTMPRFISCDLNHAKPDSEYFRHIENALGRNPEELLLLDDTHKNILGAQKAGWSAIHIDERYKLKPSKWASLEFS